MQKYSQMCLLSLNISIFQGLQSEKTLPLAAEGIFFFQCLENVAKQLSAFVNNCQMKGTETLKHL